MPYLRGIFIPSQALSTH